MHITQIPFATTNWSDIEQTEHLGDSGVAYWRTQYFGSEDNPIRVRMVEYSADYLADHWCHKGHILLVLQGELTTELDDGRVFTLSAGMSYQVADQHEAHRSSTQNGALLFIVD